jgi:hypothetical protein
LFLILAEGALCLFKKKEDRIPPFHHFESTDSAKEVGEFTQLNSPNS